MRTLATLSMLCALSACQNLDTGVKNTGQATAQRPSKATTKIAKGVEVLDLPSANLTDIDLWERTRRGFVLDYDPDAPEVAFYINRYGRFHHHINTLAERAKLYQYVLTDAVERRGMPLEIALLPMVESALDPFTDSHYHAAGLWQIIPGTATSLGLTQDWWYDGRRDLLASTEAALDYLTYLHARFNNDWLLAIAAYNSGEGTVSRAILRNKKQGKPIDFESLRLPKQTRDYVPKLLALVHLINFPEDYGIKLPPIANAPSLKTVDVGAQIDLAIAAELSEIPLRTLYRLNPGYTRWATHPDDLGPHQLLMPLENAQIFEQKLMFADSSDWVNWEAYKIQPGDSLSRIAKKSHTTVGALKVVNRLNTDQIVSGRHLLIPRPVAPYGQYTASYQGCVADSCRRERQVVHVVKSGDSLWKIAKKYKVKVNDIVGWNQIANQNHLKPGQHLVIKLIETA